MRTYDKPPAFQPGQDTISAGSLNKMIRSIPRSVVGSNGIAVKDFGDRLIVGPTEGKIIPPPDVQTFLVEQEFDDYLLCRQFTFPPDQQWQYSDNLDQQGVINDVPVLVAKPPTLQRTPWDGLMVNIGGTTYTYFYTRMGVREVQVNREEDTLEERITPAYFPGDIITAIKRTNGIYQGGGVYITWTDINDAGRQWLSLATDGGEIAGDITIQGDLRVEGDEDEPANMYLGGIYTLLWLWNPATEEYEPWDPPQPLTVMHDDESVISNSVVEMRINQDHNLEVEPVSEGVVKINWLGVSWFAEGEFVTDRRDANLVNGIATEWLVEDNEDDGQVDISLDWMGLAIEEEGGLVGNYRTVNFVGTTVTVTEEAGGLKANITITGGGSSLIVEEEDTGPSQGPISVLQFHQDDGFYVFTPQPGVETALIRMRNASQFGVGTVSIDDQEFAGEKNFLDGLETIYAAFTPQTTDPELLIPYIYSDSSGNLKLVPAGGQFLKVESSTGNTLPFNDDIASLGSVDFRWADAYITNGVTTGSDKKDKEDICECDMGLNLITKLKPVKFKWKGKERPHYGLIAQDVKQLMDEVQVDFAGWVGNPDAPDDSRQGLRYQEFIAPLIMAVQQLTVRVEQLEGKAKSKA